MGKYINQTPAGAVGASAKSKCDAIIADGAIEVPQPKEFIENLVCVVDNGMFGAAAYADTENEFRTFCRPDGRPKRWFVWKNVKQFAM